MALPIDGLISVIENKGQPSDELHHSFILNTKDEAMANIFRRTMMKHIPVYVAEFVVFHINTSDMLDTMLAHRIGLCPIDNDKDFDTSEKKFFRLNVKGPGVVYVNDIPNFPYKFNFDLCPLKEGQQLIADIYLRRKTGKYHAKCCPVSKVVFKEHEKGFQFDIELVGNVSFNNLIEKTIDNMSKELAQPPTTFFTEIVKPVGF